MARLGRRQDPAVLTGRGRRVVALVIAVATTTAAIVLTVPGLGGTRAPFSTIGGPNTMQSTDPSADGSPTGAPGDQEISELPTVERAAPPASPPLLVNGREQPPRVEPPTAASGRLVVVPGTGAPGPGAELLTYRVEIEAGLPFDGPAVAAAVHATLADPRGWATSGYAFQRVDGGEVHMRLILASPALTDQLCAPLLTRGEVSCRNGDAVVLNALRWGVGIEDYGGDLASYREYLVNHEVGHRLGRGHVPCPGPGEIAPLMMQQTYGLEDCRPNAWPLAGE